MADVAVPQGSWTLCLPAKACLASLAVLRGSADHAVLDEHPAHGALGHLGADAPVGAQRAQDERDAHVGVLAPDVEEQRAERGIEVASAPAIGTRLRHERIEAPRPEVVEPALERRDRVATRYVAARRPHPLLADAAQDRAALAVVELATGELADEAVAKDRHLLAVILGGQMVHEVSFAGVDSPARASCRPEGPPCPILLGGSETSSRAGASRPSSRARRKCTPSTRITPRSPPPRMRSWPDRLRARDRHGRRVRAPRARRHSAAQAHPAPPPRTAPRGAPPRASAPGSTIGLRQTPQPRVMGSSVPGPRRPSRPACSPRTRARSRRPRTTGVRPAHEAPPRGSPCTRGTDSAAATRAPSPPVLRPSAGPAPAARPGRDPRSRSEEHTSE